ncbi:Chondroitinase-B precursor [Roseimaritima multifibrata]|uniref:Chondroitinase-B n=1 Tax=Roseimaritima multifibrata TaxID=1930274 RepID=A0A517MIV8_9BACT|nr:polysaccharide lyase 6 family protein [Roseimaritima multifibrata]QDS94727.1 Chondroitinase-B precursor [Roseimaritima multifibrata]
MTNSICRLVLSVSLIALVLRPHTTAAAGIDNVVAAQASINAAQPGDEIVLAAGQYDDWELTIEKSGTAESPITLRGEAPGAAVFSGSSAIVVTGDHVLVRDLVFNACEPKSRRSVIRFDDAEASRVTASVFRDSRIKSGSAVVEITGKASDCRVDHCRFIGTQYLSLRVVVDDASLRDGPPVGTRIDHNIFREIPPLGANGAETIQIGSRAYPHCELETFVMVEENVFIRCNGEAEIISDKTSENTFRKNLFLDCRGELVIRHGNRSTIADNRFVGCRGGIRLSGGGHTVTGNTIINSSGSGIQLYYGVEDSKHPAAYLPVTNCVIQTNTIINASGVGLMIGANRNQSWHSARWAKKPYNASASMSATIAPAKNKISENTIIGKSDRLIVSDEAPDNEIRDNVLIDSARIP